MPLVSTPKHHFHLALAILCGFLAAVSTIPSLRAAEPADVAADVAIVSPMIGETTTLVIKINSAELTLPDLSKFINERPEDKVGTVPSSAKQKWDGLLQAPEMQGVSETLANLQAALGNQPVYATVGIPASEKEWNTFVVTKVANEAQGKLLRQRLADAGIPVEPAFRDGMLVAIPEAGRDAAAALKAVAPSPRAALHDAFQSVAGYPVQVLLLPPDYVRRTIEELLPELPRQIGGGTSAVLTEGVIWAAFGLDVAPLRAELVVQSASDEAAARLAEHFPKMLRGLLELSRKLPALGEKSTVEALESLFAAVPPRVERDRVVIRLDQPEAIEQAMERIRLAVRILEERNLQQSNETKLKTIMSGVWGYEDEAKVFPPHDKDRDEKGQPRLSWRVHILPYIGHKELYQQFHLDEPWDSAHNKRLLERMPAVFDSARSGVAPGHTTLLAPAGEDTVFGGPKATRIGDVIDGLANTVVMVEVKPQLAVPWTAPKDYAFETEAPARGLQVDADGRTIVALGDGSVKRLRADIKPETFLQLFRKSDSMPRDQSWAE